MPQRGIPWGVARFHQLWNKAWQSAGTANNPYTEPTTATALCQNKRRINPPQKSCLTKYDPIQPKQNLTTGTKQHITYRNITYTKPTYAQIGHKRHTAYCVFLQNKTNVVHYLLSG